MGDSLGDGLFDRFFTSLRKDRLGAIEGGFAPAAEGSAWCFSAVKLSSITSRRRSKRAVIVKNWVTGGILSLLKTASPKIRRLLHSAGM